MNGRYGWVLGLSLLLGACASQQEPQNYGEAMQERGAMNKDVGDKWQRGNEKVQRGTRMVSDGQALVEEGRREMTEAESKGRAVRQTPMPGDTAPATGPGSMPMR